jgi:hypothetical protein
MTDSRRRLAIHEAGHAVCGVVLGRPLEYASIRPGRSFRGVAVAVHGPTPGIAAFEVDCVVATQPPELRADVERKILTSFAGELAALYLADEPAASGYSDDETEGIADAALTELGPRIAELVVQNEEGEDTESDGDAAYRLAVAFTGSPEIAAPYVAWLQAEARGLVIRHRHAILRVADALERHAVLRGDAIAALVYPNRKD